MRRGINNNLDSKKILFWRKSFSDFRRRETETKSKFAANKNNKRKIKTLVKQKRELHRSGDPAVIHADGTREWYQNDKLTVRGYSLSDVLMKLVNGGRTTRE